MIKSTEVKIQDYNEDINGYRLQITKHNEEVRRYKDEIDDKNKLINTLEINHASIQELYSKLKSENESIKLK